MANREKFNDERFCYYSEFNNYYRGLLKRCLELHKKYLELGELHSIYRDTVVPMQAKIMQETAGNTPYNDVYFAIYYYLLWNGYFSYNQQFIAGRDNEYIPTEKGISISTGIGDCKNISCNYVDVVQTLLPKQVNLLAGTHCSYESSVVSSDKIIRKINSSESREDLKKFVFLPNHQVVFVSNMSGQYLYDPTNFMIQRFSDFSTASETEPTDLRINLGEGEFLPDVSLRISFLDKVSKSSRKLNRIRKHSYPDEALVEIMHAGIELCEDNISGIRDFHEQMNPFFKKVKESKGAYSRVLRPSNH